MIKKSKAKGRSLAQGALTAMNAVIQIYAEGVNEIDKTSILNPHFVVPFRWTGSGFFIRIGGREGYILTNAHVIRNANHIQISALPTGPERFDAEIIGCIDSLEPDIGLIKLKDDEIRRFKSQSGGRIPYLEFATLPMVKRGLEIKAIGYPLGMEGPNISGGEITNFISGDVFNTEKYVTDAAINPGNSGGPSIMEGGKVIGLNTAMVVNASNIGFITPIFYAQIVLKNLLKRQEIQFTSLGGKIQRNCKENAQFLKQKNLDGIIVNEVLPGGLMAQAGIKKWDILLGINEHRFDRHGLEKNNNNSYRRHLFDLVRLIPLGKKVKLTAMRNGKTFHAHATANSVKMPQLISRPVVKKRKFIDFGGMIVQEMSWEIFDVLSEVRDDFLFNYWSVFKSNLTPAVITHLHQGQQAERLDFAIGDMIRKIDNTEVHDINEMTMIIEKSRAQKRKMMVLETQDGKIGCFHLEIGR